VGWSEMRPDYLGRRSKAALNISEALGDTPKGIPTAKTNNKYLDCEENAFIEVHNH
jgi:hypothetical protein